MSDERMSLVCAPDGRGRDRHVHAHARQGSPRFAGMSLPRVPALLRVSQPLHD